MFASSTVADADLQSLALHTNSIKDINTVTVTCKEGGGVLDRPGLRLLHSLQYQDKYCLLCRSQAYCRSLADAICYMSYIWPVIGHEPCGIASCSLSCSSTSNTLTIERSWLGVAWQRPQHVLAHRRRQSKTPVMHTFVCLIKSSDCQPCGRALINLWVPDSHG